MNVYPLKLSYHTKSPIWGGTRLQTGWGKRSDQPTVGESWELTVREKETCRVENGVYAGMPLDQVIAEYGGNFAAPGNDGDPFPLLIKFIDATDRLSVQVHPDDAYAARVEQDRGKTEMWYVVEADEGSELICGLKDGLTREDFAAAVRDGDPECALNHRKVHAGESYFIPSGLPHAIGKGILIAEIQQNCDLTYRVFDYNRRQPDGTLRQLHVDKALDVIRPFTEEEIRSIRYEAEPNADPNGDLLAACRYFRVEKTTIREKGNLRDLDRMQHLLCLNGNATLLWNGESFPIAKGDSYLLPPHCAPSVTGNTCLLVSSV